MNDTQTAMRNLSLDDTALMALSNLSTGLWRIQELLELLTYRLDTQQALVETGRSRWLGRSTREIELVLAEMREADLMRAVDAQPVCEALGLSPETPLSAIAAAAPAPWNEVLAEHRQALSVASAELAALSRTNSEMLEVSYKAVQDTLEKFNHTPGPTGDDTYTAKGARANSRSRHLFDQKS
ncbi:FlgN protein [Dermatophilus congolensis]|uniref:FlgN protein n=2 Tax=Dermatophilus congolensis TaxID=1863 RepID=A0AA46H0Y9_9MICO|nr:FlgN protein [Dermatophilus congolensis]